MKGINEQRTSQIPTDLRNFLEMAPVKAASSHQRSRDPDVFCTISSFTAEVSMENLTPKKPVISPFEQRSSFWGDRTRTQEKRKRGMLLDSLVSEEDPWLASEASMPPTHRLASIPSLPAFERLSNPGISEFPETQAPLLSQLVPPIFGVQWERGEESLELNFAQELRKRDIALAKSRDVPAIKRKIRKNRTKNNRVT